MTLVTQWKSPSGLEFDPLNPPSLPVEGALDWDNPLNECMVWLYEYVTYNNARIVDNDASIAAMANQIETLQGEVTTLQGQVFTLQGQVATLEAKPEAVYSSYSWQFSNAAPPPTGNQVRMNNTNPALATMIEFRKIDNDGSDRTKVFQSMTAGCHIRISDWDDSKVFHSYEVAGVPTVLTDSVQVSVIWREGNGLIPNAKALVEVLVFINV